MFLCALGAVMFRFLEADGTFFQKWLRYLAGVLGINGLTLGANS